MIVGVADTHTALWYLYKNPRLSVTARTFMDDAARRPSHRIIPHQPRRNCYLVRKTGSRFPLTRICRPCLIPNMLSRAPFTAEIVEACAKSPAHSARHAGSDCSGHCGILASACHQSRRPHKVLERPDRVVISAKSAFCFARSAAFRPYAPRGGHGDDRGVTSAPAVWV